MKLTFPALCTTLSLAAAGLLLNPACAQSVAMTGGMGSKALLVINGGAPKALAAGEAYQGVKVVSVTADRVVVETGGQRQTVVLGGAPVSIGGGGGGSASGTRIVLTAAQGGHFVTLGQINGRSAQFVVDTGATFVAMGADDANRMGIAYTQGKPVSMSTANGVAPAYRITLNSVRVQDVELHNVDAVVMPTGMPYILLGNSFLGRFQMLREADTLTLTRRF